jgi:predicted nucleotidyltransferase
MEKQELIKKLNSFFSAEKREPFIKLAYLFGSRAVGSEGPISDFDIAVLYSKTPLPDMRYRLAHKLTALLVSDKVDVLVLNSAPVELSYAVIATGLLAYEVSATERVEYEAFILSCYGDFLPILRQQRNEILEDRDNETGIQRYRATLGKTQRLLEKIRTF